MTYLLPNCSNLEQKLKKRKGAQKSIFGSGSLSQTFLIFLVYFDIEMAKIYLEYPSRAIFKEKNSSRRKTILFLETQNMTSS